MAEYRSHNSSADRLVITVGRTCVCGSTEYNVGAEAVRGFFDAIEFSHIGTGHADAYADIEVLVYRGNELLDRNKLHSNNNFISLSDTDVTLTRASSVKLTAWFAANQISLRENRADCIGNGGPCADASIDPCLDGSVIRQSRK